MHGWCMDMTIDFSLVGSHHISKNPCHHKPAVVLPMQLHSNWLHGIIPCRYKI